LAQEEKFIQEAGLGPVKAMRVRRKSRELQLEAIEIMGPKLESTFKQFDLDGSGTLTPMELKQAFKAAGRAATDASVKKCMDLLDTNNDGVIDLEEFKAIAWHMETMAK